MSYTSDEHVQLLQGESEAAYALTQMIKVAFVKKVVGQQIVQEQILEGIESWVALREQRILAEEAEDPMHIFN